MIKLSVRRAAEAGMALFLGGAVPSRRMPKDTLGNMAGKAITVASTFPKPASSHNRFQKLLGSYFIREVPRTVAIMTIERTPLGVQETKDKLQVL